MTITTSYTSAIARAAAPVNLTTASDQEQPTSVTRADGTSVVFFQDFSVGGGRLLARTLNASGVPTGTELLIDAGPLSSLNAKTVSAAALTNGNILVSWINASNDIYYRLYDQTMTALGVAVLAETASGAATGLDVAAMQGGAFVIAWEREFSAADHDIVYRRFNNAGTGLDPSLGVNVSPISANDLRPSVAVLNDDKIVIAFERNEPPALTWSMQQTIIDVDGTIFMPVTLVDDIGTQNRFADLTALSNGGYLLTYSDNGWDGTGDLTSARFNASGIVQAYTQTVDNTNPSVTLPTPSTDTSSNGFVVGTYYFDQSFQNRLFLMGPNAQPLLFTEVILNQNVGANADVEWIGASHVLLTETSAQLVPVGDGSGTAATSTLIEIRRVTTGDEANDTYNAPFDGMIDYVYGGNGADTLDGASGNDVVVGGDGDDLLYGGFGTDYVIGGNGNDQMYGGAVAADTLQGGPGDDVYAVESYGTSTFELAGEGTDQVASYLPVFVLQANVEHLTMLDAGSNVGIGNTLDNIVRGNTAYDELFGGAGNDTLWGWTGAANALLGGTGDDIYLVEAVGDSTIELPGEGMDEVQTIFGIYGLQANIENLRFLDNATHAAGVGNALDNIIYGGSGADSLFGREGNDALYGILYFPVLKNRKLNF